MKYKIEKDFINLIGDNFKAVWIVTGDYYKNNEEFIKNSNNITIANVGIISSPQNMLLELNDNFELDIPKNDNFKIIGKKHNYGVKLFNSKLILCKTLNNFELNSFISSYPTNEAFDEISQNASVNDLKILYTQYIDDKDILINSFMINKILIGGIKVNLRGMLNA